MTENSHLYGGVAARKKLAGALLVANPENVSTFELLTTEVKNDQSLRLVEDCSR
jgi:hypothetical protein